MKTKDEIRARIKQFRIARNDAKRFEGTEGYVYLANGAIKALEWILGFKRKRQWWCYKCALLHTGLKCPRCGNEIEHKVAEAIGGKG